MLGQRVLTALIAVVLLLSLLFFAPPFVVRIVIALLFAAAAWEWSQFLDTTSHGVRLLYVALVVVLGSMFTVAFADAQLQLALFALAIVWWLAAFIWVFNFPTPIPTAASWVCGLLVLVPAYVALDVLYLQSPWLLLALKAEIQDKDKALGSMLRDEKELLSLIKALAEEGRTMLVVTHEMGFAREVSSRVIFLHQGLVEEDGAPQQVFENPASERFRQFLSGALK